MPEIMEVYQTNGLYEPCTKWFIEETPADAAEALSKAFAIATAIAPLVSSAWEFVRWVSRDSAGRKRFEGNFASYLPGTASGEVVAPKYALLLRIASAAVKRPSVKFIHGFTEGDMVNGNPSGGLLTAINAAGVALAAAGVLDSDGNPLTDLIFRSFSRRRKVRRAG